MQFFCFVSFWKDSLQVLGSFICVFRDTESQCRTLYNVRCDFRQILLLDVRVNACHSQWLTLKLTFFQNVFTQILVQVCTCYNCLNHLLCFRLESSILFSWSDRANESMSLCLWFSLIFWSNVWSHSVTSNELVWFSATTCGRKAVPRLCSEVFAYLSEFTVMWTHMSRCQRRLRQANKSDRDFHRTRLVSCTPI